MKIKNVNIDKSGISLPRYEMIFKTLDQLKPNDHSLILEIGVENAGQAQFMQVKESITLDYGDDVFNSCVTVNTIYFWQDPITQLKEIYRVLRPGGSLSLTFTEKKFGGNLPWTQADFTFYDINEVELFFRKSGFVNIEVEKKSEEIIEEDCNDMITPFVTIAGRKQVG